MSDEQKRGPNIAADVTADVVSAVDNASANANRNTNNNNFGGIFSGIISVIAVLVMSACIWVTASDYSSRDAEKALVAVQFKAMEREHDRDMQRVNDADVNFKLYRNDIVNLREDLAKQGVHAKDIFRVLPEPRPSTQSKE